MIHNDVGQVKIFCVSEENFTHHIKILHHSTEKYLLWPRILWCDERKYWCREIFIVKTPRNKLRGGDLTLLTSCGLVRFSGEISNLNRQIFWLIFFDTFWWSIALWKPSLYFDPSQIASVIIPGFSWWRDLRTQWEHGWLQAARPGQGPQDPDGLAA